MSRRFGGYGSDDSTESMQMESYSGIVSRLKTLYTGLPREVQKVFRLERLNPVRAVDGILYWRAMSERHDKATSAMQDAMDPEEYADLGSLAVEFGPDNRDSRRIGIKKKLRDLGLSSDDIEDSEKYLAAALDL